MTLYNPFQNRLIWSRRIGVILFLIISVPFCLSVEYLNAFRFFGIFTFSFIITLPFYFFFQGKVVKFEVTDSFLVVYKLEFGFIWKRTEFEIEKIKRIETVIRGERLYISTMVVRYSKSQIEYKFNSTLNGEHKEAIKALRNDLILKGVDFKLDM